MRHRLPEPARNHRAGPITAPDRRQPLIGRKVQTAAGVLWRDVTHEDHSWHMLPHRSPAVDWATLPACLPLLSSVVQVADHKAAQRAPVESKRDWANVANDIIIDIFDLLWKPPNLSYVFKIIFVVEYVSAFAKCQLKFITLITIAHTQWRTHGPQYSTVF